MKLIRVAYKYLKAYPTLATCAIFSIITMSLFDGVSFGMLVPLIQSMTSESVSTLSIIPFLQDLKFFSFPTTQAGMTSFIFMLLLFALSIKNVFTFLSNMLITKLRFGIIRDLRVKLMNNLLEYDLKYFDRSNSGYIISNMNFETQRMGDFMLAILNFSALAGRVLVYITILFLISWKVSAVVFLLIAIVLLLIELIMKKVKKLGKYLSQAIANYNYKLTEVLAGIRLVKRSGTEEEEKRNFGSVADKYRYFQYKSSKTMNLIAPLAEVIIFGLLAVLFLVLINVIKIDIVRAFPFVATYLLVLARSLTQLNGMNTYRSAAMNNLAAFSNYEDICDPNGKITIKSGNKKPGNISECIEFKNVNFSYEEGKTVLENICIKIPKGKMTAIVGRSGSGKSTIVNLIPRFYEVNSGQILVDNRDLKTFVLKDWRKKIGFVSQDIFIFNTSVKKNITYGFDGLSGGEVIKAAKATNAHDFIMNLPERYDSILGERGIKLSEGQKQRVSIARAIIHNPEVLILDEATSSLDSETEKSISGAIDNLTKGRTVIAIAHRLSTILHADNIVVLDDGKVLEEGKHSELISKNGLYKRLYDAQFRI